MSDFHPVLSPVEARVLGTLLEKQRTVPETYPLSMNALLAGCNQKTSRQPVMELIEPDVLQALNRLRELGLVSSESGGRVTRYAHHLEKTLGVPGQAAALLTVLMLRGPLTVGELRLNSERLHRFADISSVEAFLEELASRPDDPLVVELPRLPGARENRWMHCLSGAPEFEAAPPGRPVRASSNQEVEALGERVTVLESEVASLKALLAELRSASRADN